MKLKHIYFASLMAVAGGMFAGCSDDIENFDNQMFVTDTTPAVVLMMATAEDETQEFTFSIPKPQDSDVTFTIAADANKVQTYKDLYTDGTKEIEMVPSANYELATTQGVIRAGSLNSDPIAINFIGLSTMDDTKTYVLPITVTNCSIGVLGSQNTRYYVFQKGALINVVANLDDNALRPGNAWATPDKFRNLTKLTCEALIYPYSLSGEGHESGISTLMGIEGNFLFRFGDAGLASNILQIATGSAGNFAVSRAVEENVWTHVAVTYDSDAQEIKVYFNGSLVDTFTGVTKGPVDWSPEYSNDNDGKARSFWVGHSYSASRWFEGEMSEVRIWDKVLTPEEINAENHFYAVLEPENEPNLLMYWKLNDGVDEIKDYSQYGNNGVAEVAGLQWVSVSLPATE